MIVHFQVLVHTCYCKRWQFSILLQTMAEAKVKAKASRVKARDNKIKARVILHRAKVILLRANIKIRAKVILPKAKVILLKANIKAKVMQPQVKANGVKVLLPIQECISHNSFIALATMSVTFLSKL